MIRVQTLLHFLLSTAFICFLGTWDLKAQVTLLKDINPGTNSSSPRGLYVFEGKVYFLAYDPVHGREIWATDGTKAGTQLIKDMRPGTRNSDPIRYFGWNGKVYFFAFDNTHGYELWSTDGTEAGTQLVKDVIAGTGGTKVTNLVVYNNKLYFLVEDQDAKVELWESDGTEAGTQLVKKIDTPSGVSHDPSDIIVYDGKIYFGVNGNNELWQSDGTTANTVSITTPISVGVDRFEIVDNKLYISRNGIYTLNAASEIVTVSTSVSLGAMYTWNGKPHFVFNKKGYLLDTSNDTATQVSFPEHFSSDPINFKGALYYGNVVETPLGDISELHKAVDGGGDVSTKILTLDASWRLPKGFISLGDVLCFTSNDKIWRTDGTSEGTAMVTGFLQSPEMVVLNGQLYTVRAEYKGLGQELYQINLVTPTITEFGPSQADEGDIVTIKGTNFTTDPSHVNVRIGVNKVSIVSMTDTEIKIKVPKAYTSKISVEVLGAKAYSSEVLTIVPKINSVEPKIGQVGTEVKIKGSGFAPYRSFTLTKGGPSPNPPDSINIVKFNGVQAVVSKADYNEMTVKVPSGATSGLITITVNGEPVTSADPFVVVNGSPQITNITPLQGITGQEITISGSGFIPNDLSNNKVFFNGIPALVISATETTLKVKVPGGNTTGNITVQLGPDSWGYKTTSSEVFTALPNVIFAPKSGTPGEVITFGATNFSFSSVPSENVVKFNGVVATVINAATNQLHVVVPEQATTGKVSVTTNGTEVTSAEDFTVKERPPASVLLSPSFGVAGDFIIITAVNFSFRPVASENTVRFNGVIAPVSNASFNQLVVLVPSRVTTGKVSVTVGGNTATSTQDFLVTNDPTGLPQNLTQGKLTLYPNPVVGILRLKLEGSPASELQVTVFDTRGQKVMQDTPVLQNGLASLNLESLPSGKYILKIQVGAEAVRRNILKE